MQKEEFSPRELSRKEHGSVICYPGTNLDSFHSRLDQLEEIGVTKLIFEGESKVGALGIIGRGCVSTVVKARLKNQRRPVALKIRRVDANRKDMKRDYDLQTFANSFGVGPKAYAFTKDLFAMEYIDAVKLGKWFQKLRTRTSKRHTRALIHSALDQCYRLDANGLDHGELSNPRKHLLIRNGTIPEIVIIDYESASRERRVSNLTAVTSFFFLGGRQSEKVRKILGFEKFPRKRLMERLKDYKSEPSEERLSQILGLVRC